MTLHRFRRCELAPQPWKNGGGSTQEIVCWPVGSELADFDWRISIAHIDRSGPFSTFSGVDRVITLLDGAGVELRSAESQIAHRLDTPLQTFAFSGDDLLHAELLGKDCYDFNVMTRRATCVANVQVHHEGTALAGSTQGLLFTVQGKWAVTIAGEIHLLDEADGLWWQDEHEPVLLAPDFAGSALISVLVH